MTEWILIRHGQSTGNTGQSKECDCDLTRRGEQQARALSQRISTIANIEKFAVLVSPYKRARRTAELAFGSDSPTQIEPEVREYAGRCDVSGSTYERESFDQFIGRMRRFYEDNKHRDLIIVSHAAFIGCLTQIINGVEPYHDIWKTVENCCFRRISMNEGPMFEKAFVINLPFKTDRLETFKAAYPSCLPPVQVWPAVHGDSVKHPSTWTAGNGAWGCYRSHMQILEYCYQNNVESYVVFEDDAIFKKDFEQQFRTFERGLPDDWEQVYLGGQLLHSSQYPPREIADNVYFPRNVNRTHCFGIHKRGYERIYRHLNELPFLRGYHIDHRLGELHDSGTLRVYVPGKWLVGQDGGPSNISGRHNAATFWIDPERLSNAEKNWNTRVIPTVFLESTIEVAVELERRGWHRGHWQNEQRLDRGVCNAIAGLTMKADLLQWQRAVIPEAVREGKSCVCLFHPSLVWPCVEAVGFEKITRIVAETAEEAELQLAALETSGVSVPIQRNLIYHIWPRKGNGVWQWNVEQLMKRIDQFDGVRSIAVATSPDADTLEDVQRAFDGCRIDNWIEYPNDPILGESQTFVQLLETLPVGDGSITFRGHAKGVKYDNPLMCRDWTEMLYEICLDDQEHISASLSQFPVAGPFCVDNRWPGGNLFGWYYSGGFYWFTDDILKRPNCKEIRKDYWGVELWPGEHYDRTEVGILFGQNCGHLYEASEVDRMKVWLGQWKATRRPGSQKLPSIAVVIPTLGRPLLANMLASLIPQMLEKDEIIVVADGPEALERVTPICEGLPVRVAEASNPESVYGNHQRNVGIKMATGDLLWFCDDDDVVPPDAMITIRKVMAEDMTPTMFRQNHLGNIIWQTKEIIDGQVSSTQLICPNTPDLLPFPVPSFPERGTDFRWIQEINAKKPIRWNDSVIYLCEKSRWGKFE